MKFFAGLTAGIVGFFAGLVAAFEYGLDDSNKELVVALGAAAIAAVAGMRILSNATRNAGPNTMGVVRVAMIVVGCSAFASFFVIVMH